MKTIVSLFILIALIISCSNKKNETEQKQDQKNEALKETEKILIEGNADTIKKDYYSDLIIYDNIEPKGKNPSGKNYNEQIYKSFYLQNPSLEKIKEIFNFYKLYYSKRAIINNEITLNLWFFDKKVPYAVANPENLDTDIKYEKNIACVFIYNYKNSSRLEDCSSYDKFNNYYYSNK